MTSRDESTAARSEPDEVSVFRDRSISYMEIPARSVAESARFYAHVFGWSIRGANADPAFTDGSGHVIGHWRPDLAVAEESGLRAYIYVIDIDDVLARIAQNGGQIVTPRFDEGDLWVAHFRDPAGNVLGVWERAGDS